MDCRMSGSPVHGILQVRILEWVAIPSSRGSSQPRDRTAFLMPPALEKKRKISRKISTSALLTIPKPLHGSQQTGKFLKTWEYQTTSPASWEICMQVRKQQLELDMEQQTGFKSGKEYFKAVYCHPTYLTYMQLHHEKDWAGGSTSWNQDCWEKY